MRSCPVVQEPNLGGARPPAKLSLMIMVEAMICDVLTINKPGERSGPADHHRGPIRPVRMADAFQVKEQSRR